VTTLSGLIASRWYPNVETTDGYKLVLDQPLFAEAGSAGFRLELYRVGKDSAAALLLAAGDNPERLKSEASWARLCGVSPIEASSGKITRHRLNPFGNRQANAALWHIVIARISSDPRTRLYMERRSKEGRSEKEIIRVLKRYVAREVYPRIIAAA
jgi:transposase